jgi:phosphotriesterase-related protein
MVASNVQTVSGPLAVAELGTTLMHEHICMGSEGMLLDSRFEMPSDRFERAVRQLKTARQAGVDSMVDATPIDLNRDAGFLKEVADASGMNIICATGLYFDGHGLPAHFKSMSLQDLTDLYVCELTDGIGRTGVRAGVLKVATGEQGITPADRKSLEAAAVAQQATGVPIITHTSGGFGVEQAKALVESGADPAKVMIGHVDHKFSSFSYLERILRTGVNIAFDRCGLGIFLPDSLRAALVAGLIDIGFGNRVFLSMDSVLVQYGPVSAFEADAKEPLVYVVGAFADTLKRFGVDRDQQQAILGDNPARLFGPSATVK